MTGVQTCALPICNHSATHLLHHALRQVLGFHVEQKGSLVEPTRLRFDFSHFQKLTSEELQKVERIVNEHIRRNEPLNEMRDLAMDDARKMGAMALFGEKYGDLVRVIQFGDSVELCGGIHASSTGEIGMLKIISEGAIAAGVRRIEAITGLQVEEYMEKELDLLNSLRAIFKNPKDLLKSVEQLQVQNDELSKKLEAFEKEKLKVVRDQLKNKIKPINGLNMIVEKVEVDSVNNLKDLAFLMKNSVDNLVLVLATEINQKPNIAVLIADNLVADKQLHAGNLVRELAKEINGGGGGQAFFATAGGTDCTGIERALSKVRQIFGKN